MAEKVYLVDGSGYIFRAYYAVQSLSTRDGFPTNALFGYFRMLIKLLNQSDSEHVVMVFDTGEKNFRHQLFPDYKANRPPCPQDLALQMPYFRKIAKALGMLVLEHVGYEADDLIATLALRVARAGNECVIITGDKDLMQLVGPNISIWDAMKDKKIGPAQVREKFGVDPEQVVDVLAIMGDSSDNVPGLKGVGPKSAAQVVSALGHVENIIKSARSIEGLTGIRNRKKIVELIESAPDALRLSKRLVELDLDVPIQIPVGDQVLSVNEVDDTHLIGVLTRSAPDRAELTALVEKLEFHSLLETLKLSDPENSTTTNQFKYECVWERDFPEFLRSLHAQKRVAVDLETTSLDYQFAKIVGVSFCWESNRAYYVPCGHTALAESGVNVRVPKQISVESLLAQIGPILRDSRVGKVGQNLKYDASVLGEHGIELNGIDFDTMVASYLLNPDKRSHNLSVLAWEYLGRRLTEYDDLVEKGEDFTTVEINKATDYCCQDSHCAWLIAEKLAPEIEKNGLSRVMNELEMPLVLILANLERRGIKVDPQFLKSMSLEFEKQLALLEQEIYSLVGCQFNINSPKQLSEVLYTKLNIPTKGLKKTKSGVSTDSSVLEKLVAHHPVAQQLLKYRTVHKLKSTYLDALPAQISQKTGRIHSRFHQTQTGTGRLSSSDPNLQNIPIRDVEGRKIRQAFIADQGNVLIVADYSQIELRLLAHMSEDLVLVEAFRNGEDIHAKTTREILGAIGTETVTADQRRIGKTINFGIIYGMGPFRLARELGIPFNLAKEYIANYFERYAGVRRYFDRLADQIKTQGYVSTIFGRRRNIDQINVSGRDPEFVQRAALNAPIQGSAADLIKLAMIEIDHAIRARKVDLSLVLQVHDELVFECPESTSAAAINLVREKMEQAVELKVPLKVDMGFGKNWQEAHQ